MFWCAASAGAGAATADLTYAGLAVTGGAGLATSIEAIAAPMRWISATVLMLLAIRGLVQARHQPATAAVVVPDRREHAKTYLTFLGLTVINPMTVVYFAAIVLGLGLTEDLGAGQTALFVAGRSSHPCHGRPRSPAQAPSFATRPPAEPRSGPASWATPSSSR